ncbi:hypothetical protein [Eubacterium maltosivorans]|uniref:hypothetical protein n=1 Tax=Eubacterium maltosivorans TaxID=2041044 RepID=UPI00189EC331|nr:hypothetical protein [Eubacterium maltosivorans]
MKEEKTKKIELAIAIIALVISVVSLAVSLSGAFQEYRRKVEVDIPEKPTLVFKLNNGGSGGITTPISKTVDDFFLESGQITAYIPCKFYAFNPYRSAIILKNIKIQSPSGAIPNRPLSFTYENSNDFTVIPLSENDVVSFTSYIDLIFPDQLIKKIKSEMNDVYSLNGIDSDTAKKIINLINNYFTQNPPSINIEFVTMPNGRLIKKSYQLMPVIEEDNPHQLVFSVSQIIDKK